MVLSLLQNMLWSIVIVYLPIAVKQSSASLSNKIKVTFLWK